MAVRWAQQGPPSAGRRIKITTYNRQQPGDDACYQGFIVLLAVTIFASQSVGAQPIFVFANVNLLVLIHGSRPSLTLFGQEARLCRIDLI
eukprot:651252-Heterocapsa_arctica.AAC.1